MNFTRRQMVIGLMGLGVGAGLSRKLWASPTTASLFNHQHRRALVAAYERILPGATQAKVADYIDYWMRREPFKSKIKPFFEIAADKLDQIAQKKHAKVFAALDGKQQDEILEAFQKGEVSSTRFRSDKFFEFLVRFTLEGFLCEPKYGGNKNQVGWKYIGHHHCWWAPKNIKTRHKPNKGLAY
jgi:gluconate 2-dehydrogenase gamma chain